MAQLKKIGPLSCGKVLGALYVVIGIIVGGAVFLGSFLSPEGTKGLGIIFFLLLPVFYGIMGFFGGIVAAWLYNITASKVGGIEVTIQ